MITTRLEIYFEDRSDKDWSWTAYGGEKEGGVS
jgi:hypothetical protein